jgi:hypothetical protein
LKIYETACVEYCRSSSALNCSIIMCSIEQSSKKREVLTIIKIIHPHNGLLIQLLNVYTPKEKRGQSIAHSKLTVYIIMSVIRV